MTHPYATDAYAKSLVHEGCAVRVPEWGCSVVIRPAAHGAEDAAGPYPLTIMDEQADIAGGLLRLQSLGLVSVVAVVDDVHRPSIANLGGAFDFVRPFKRHFLHRPTGASARYSKHHDYEVRRALRSVTAGPIDLPRHLDAWMELYETLKARHKLSGIQNFPAKHHRTLATLDGVTAIGAWLGRELAACHIWVHDDGYVHSHLGASSEAGYRCRASYAVYDASIRHFSGAKLINMGGVPGDRDDPNDGLAFFKRGFANATAQSYLCGKILDPDRYRELVELRAVPPHARFFPAYRAV